MKNLTAEQAITEIKQVRTTFMGLNVQKYNYKHEIRSQLQIMAEQNKISPSEFLRSLKLTWPHESKALRNGEYRRLNK